jgi:hypothetical protein
LWNFVYSCSAGPLPGSTLTATSQLFCACIVGGVWCAAATGGDGGGVGEGRSGAAEQDRAQRARRGRDRARAPPGERCARRAARRAPLGEATCGPHARAHWPRTHPLIGDLRHRGGGAGLDLRKLGGGRWNRPARAAKP